MFAATAAVVWLYSGVAAATITPQYHSLPLAMTKSPESVLYGFTAGGAYGSYPDGGVIKGDNGVLYGTASEGGLYQGGVVFALTPSSSGYTETILHNFHGGSDGARPMGGVIDIHGSLFGTTLNGGPNDLGTVFRLTPSASGYTESILHRFAGGAADGEHPFAGLIKDKHGNLYGTTGYGGSFGSCEVPNCGSIFELTRIGDHYAETVLHLFTDDGDGTDPYDSLVMDANGVLYGTTEGGGVSNDGTVFSLSPASGPSSYSILYSFTGEADGAFPYASLTLGPGGTLYGTNTQSNLGNPGTAFVLKPMGPSGYSLTTIFTFEGGAEGAGPYTNLVLRSKGQLCGTTYSGGPESAGVVFCLNPTEMGYSERIVYSFLGGNGDGSGPIGNIIAVGNVIYGSTNRGWTNGEGVVYKVKL